VVADLAFPVGVVGIEVRAQVVEAGVGVEEQVPDDDQDRTAEGDDRFLRAAAAGDAAVAYAGVNTRRVGRGAGSLPPAGTLDRLSDRVGTCTRISGPALLIRGPGTHSGCLTSS
jgi:hypothetical protein